MSTEQAVNSLEKYLAIASGPHNVEPVDLNTSLSSACDLLHVAISESGAAIHADPLPVVSADPDHMVAMFELLLDNSIKFRNPDIAPQIRITVAPAGERPVISIADNGIGIEPQFREVVFLPFNRPNGRKFPGAGLGLSIAKLLAALNGGDIRIETVAEMGGTSVQFTVPVASSHSRDR